MRGLGNLLFANQEHQDNNNNNNIIITITIIIKKIMTLFTKGDM